MKTTLGALAAVLTLAAAVSPALADPQANRADQTRPAVPPRAIFICAADQDTRAAFQRQHGVDPVFMSAEQVLEARRDDITWQAPRCMTEREYARLSQGNTAFAEQRRQ